MSETRSPRKKWFAAALLAVVAVLVPATIASATGGPNAQLVSQNSVYGGGQYTVSPRGVRSIAPTFTGGIRCIA